MRRVHGAAALWIMLLLWAAASVVCLTCLNLSLPATVPACNFPCLKLCNLQLDVEQLCYT
jgi:hypothetical protein